MGFLFGRKECAFCGARGKETGCTIRGSSVCTDCLGVVDVEAGHMPDTIQKFAVYRAFRAGNRELAEDFQTDRLFQWPGVAETPVFDYTHHRLCFSAALDRTVFSAGEVTAVTVAEDDHVILRGTRMGLQPYESIVPMQMKKLLPLIERVNLEKQKYDRLKKMIVSGSGKTPVSGGAPKPVPRPFEKFLVTVEFSHPYWEKKTLVIDAPHFSPTHPSTSDYMRQYNEAYAGLHEFASVAVEIMFPHRQRESKP